MSNITANPFYRPAFAQVPMEDGLAINDPAKMYVVSDGVSGPYCPAMPGIQYPKKAEKITGGQMVTECICDAVSRAMPSSLRVRSSIIEVLIGANTTVLANHMAMGQDPALKAVAGASVSGCQILEDGRVMLVEIGDCFTFYKDRIGFHFRTNFDQAAFDFEQRGNEAFDQCLKEACGNKGVAWNFYYPYFAQKQFDRANRNMGKLGHAVLNGNPHFLQCMSTKIIEPMDLEWILLGTDGLLTADCTNPKNRVQFEQDLGQMYLKGGLPAIIEWRDKADYLPHISGYPEASAIEIFFDKTF